MHAYINCGLTHTHAHVCTHRPIPYGLKHLCMSIIGLTQAHPTLACRLRFAGYVCMYVCMYVCLYVCIGGRIGWTVVHAVHLQQQVNEPHGTNTAIQHVTLYAHYSVQGLVLQYLQISSHQQMFHLWKLKCMYANSTVVTALSGVHLCS